MRQAFVLPIVLAATLAGCGSDYPEEPAGQRVLGKLLYTGTAHEVIENPALMVLAYTSFPPAAGTLPHAADINLAPAFPDGERAYEILHLEPHAYFVFAQIVDLDESDAMLDPDFVPPAMGAYPSLLPGPEAVEVTEDRPARNIDMELFDLRAP